MDDEKEVDAYEKMIDLSMEDFAKYCDSVDKLDVASVGIMLHHTYEGVVEVKNTLIDAIQSERIFKDKNTVKTLSDLYGVLQRVEDKLIYVDKFLEI